MGRGLQLQPEGIHVAFCAGTGTLVFLDLVAHLLILNTLPKEEVPPEMRNFYQSGFKLHLYVAFQNREQSIGLDLIEALQQVNQARGYNNFALTVRLSEPDAGQAKMPRWTDDFIDKELTPLAGQMKKIWVCGPPVMNELFDKTLEKIASKLQVEAHQIDVM